MEPLASKYRPKTLDEFVGQSHLIGEDGPIKRLIQSGEIPSMIFWGPPGTGKTTLAYIISQDLRYDFYKLQAVSAGKKKLMEVLKIAMQNREFNKKTILFLDEIHRWNKAQQDALLPYVEKGIITLIGATTENPSFSVNNALLSRARVFTFNSLTPEEISERIGEVVKIEFTDLKINKDVLESIAQLANGDMRSAYNILELSISIAEAHDKDGKTILKKEHIEQSIQKSIMYDRNGEEHYNIISALHKSMRASDPHASVYWCMRMIEGGEDPLYIARRMVRFAAEDIGNGDPQALILATSVFDACSKIGLPECEVHLVQLAIYLAKAPKDNSAYTAVAQAKEDIKKYGNLPVPLHLRNAPTKLMKDLGYSKGYVYDHDAKGKKSNQQCMPEKLKRRKYSNL